MNDTLEQFNMKSQYIQEQNIYLDLINNRSSAIDNMTNKYTVLMGYSKIMNLIHRRLVISELQKQSNA